MTPPAPPPAARPAPAPAGRPVPARPRILLAKPGLDGHDRGIKVVAMALRDAGAEVIYLGLRATAAQITAAAAAEDADLIGISVLSGAHLPITEQLLAGLRAAGVDVPLVIGGTIPPADAAELRRLGVAGVFAMGTALPDAVAGTLALAGVGVQVGVGVQAAVGPSPRAPARQGERGAAP